MSELIEDEFRREIRWPVFMPPIQAWFAAVCRADPEAFADFFREPDGVAPHKI